VYDSAGVLGSVPVRETAPLLLTLAMKPLGRRQLESVRVVAAMSGKAAVMRCARACGGGFVLAAKKHLEAKGREKGGFILLSPSLATSAAELLFVFFLLPAPEPAACA